MIHLLVYLHLVVQILMLYYGMLDKLELRYHLKMIVMMHLQKSSLYMLVMKLVFLMYVSLAIQEI